MFSADDKECHSFEEVSYFKNKTLKQPFPRKQTDNPEVPFPILLAGLLTFRASLE